MPDKTTLLFNTLKSDPLYKDAGLGNSVESFKEYFSDPAKGQQLYNTLSSDPNYKNSGLGSSYNSFANYFGLKKKDSGIPSSIALPKQSQPSSQPQGTGSVLKSTSQSTPQQQASAQVQSVVNAASPKDYGGGDVNYSGAQSDNKQWGGINTDLAHKVKTESIPAVNYNPVAPAKPQKELTPVEQVKDIANYPAITSDEQFNQVKDNPNKTPMQFEAMVAYATTKAKESIQNQEEIQLKTFFNQIASGERPLQHPIQDNAAAAQQKLFGNVQQQNIPAKVGDDVSNAFYINMAKANGRDLSIHERSMTALDFITEQSYNNTAIGIADAIANSKFRYDPAVLEKYDSNWLEDAAAMMLSTGLDWPVLGFGSLLAMPIKDATEVAIKNIVSSQAKKYVETGLTEELANKLAAQHAKYFATGMKMAAQGASSGIELGTYGAAKDALNQFAENPDLNFEDWKWQQSLKKGTDDFKLGLGLGVFSGVSKMLSEKASQVVSDPARFATQMGIKTSSLGAEAALFTYGGAALEGKDFDTVTGRDIAENVAF
jgi:hypothetical protein